MSMQDNTLSQKPRRRVPAEARAGEGTEVKIAFDDNRLASLVLGQFDENLAHIERRLGVRELACESALSAQDDKIRKLSSFRQPP